MAKRIINSRLSPPCVRDFIKHTYPNAANIGQEMGRLKDAGISPQQFSDFCGWFAEGVAYVHQQFPGAAPPKEIVFFDSPKDPSGNYTYAEYNPDTQVIRVNREFCLDTFQPDPDEKVYADDGKTLEVTRAQLVTLVGIEEAYHHNQWCGGAKSRQRYMRRRWAEGGDDSLQDPIEQDADRFVVKAARDLGYIPGVKKSR